MRAILRRTVVRCRERHLEWQPRLQISGAQPTRGHLTFDSDLTCTRPTYTTGLRWNRVSHLKPRPEVENLPPDHSCSTRFQRDNAANLRHVLSVQWIPKLNCRDAPEAYHVSMN
ncbi:hypothetical protein AVEN_125391-1 [Araneus ventricosus]|uniref:Uncharacterized protein n=1 Tax=Araneus ventricosus TaxID=182803 RepID=A0A4Y2M5J9_ARAVE|nr:hypothetical protein AVEN_125391-1 [Araneus ventricosus]